MIVKNFQYYKKGIGIESKKVWKQDRGQGNKVGEWKQVKDEAQGLLNV